MPRSYRSLPHHNGNLLASVDLETTGTHLGYHEIIQVAIQPLDIDYEPHPTLRNFTCYMRPLFPERADPLAMRVNQLSLKDLETAAHPDEVEDALIDWKNKLGLPIDRRMIPVAHNWPFEKGMAGLWLGVPLLDEIFMGIARDSQALALGINDMAAYQGKEIPFKEVNLKWLSNYFGIVNPRPHDALPDAITGARVYAALTKFDVLL